MTCHALVKKTLDGYLGLESGWDGYDAKKASVASVDEAKLFIDSLDPLVVTPISMLDCNGEVSLFWTMGRCSDNHLYVEISFPGDQTFHFIISEPNDRFASEDLPIFGWIDATLSSLFRRLSRKDVY